MTIHTVEQRIRGMTFAQAGREIFESYKKGEISQEEYRQLLDKYETWGGVGQAKAHEIVRPLPGTTEERAKAYQKEEVHVVETEKGRFGVSPGVARKLEPVIKRQEFERRRQEQIKKGIIKPKEEPFVMIESPQAIFGVSPGVVKRMEEPGFIQIMKRREHETRRQTQIERGMITTKREIEIEKLAKHPTVFLSSVLSFKDPLGLRTIFAASEENLGLISKKEARERVIGFRKEWIYEREKMTPLESAKKSAFESGVIATFTFVPTLAPGTLLGKGVSVAAKGLYSVYAGQTIAKGIAHVTRPELGIKPTREEIFWTALPPSLYGLRRGVSYLRGKFAKPTIEIPKVARTITTGEAITEPKYGKTLSMLKTIGKREGDIVVVKSTLITKTTEKFGETSRIITTGITRGWQRTISGEIRPFYTVETGISFPYEKGIVSAGMPFTAIGKEIVGARLVLPSFKLGSLQIPSTIGEQRWTWRIEAPSVRAFAPYPEVTKTGEIMELGKWKFIPSWLKGWTAGRVAIKETISAFLGKTLVKHYMPVFEPSGGVKRVITGFSVSELGIAEPTVTFPEVSPKYPIEPSFWGTLGLGWTAMREAAEGIKKKPRYVEEFIFTPPRVISKERLTPRIKIELMGKTSLSLVNKQVQRIGKTTIQQQTQRQIQRLGVSLGQIPTQISVQRQIQRQVQKQRQMQRQMQLQIPGLAVVTTPPPTRITIPPYVKFQPRFYPYRPKKRISFGLKRVLKRSERASKFLPTSSLFNIEKTIKKYGMFSLPRGRIPEKIFWKGFKRKGVFMEFPTQQQLKSILGGVRKVVRKKKKKKR